ENGSPFSTLMMHSCLSVLSALRVAESSAMVQLAVHRSPKNGPRPRGRRLLRTRDWRKIRVGLMANRHSQRLERVCPELRSDFDTEEMAKRRVGGRCGRSAVGSEFDGDRTQ